MPHIRIEYTRNLDAVVKEGGLLRAVHAAAAGCGVFPLWGVRTFAQPVDAYCVAQADAGNGFVHIAVRIAPGRSEAVRRQVAQRLLDAALACLAPRFEAGRIGCQVELSEFDRASCLYRIRVDEGGGAMADHWSEGAPA